MAGKCWVFLLSFGVLLLCSPAPGVRAAEPVKIALLTAPGETEGQPDRSYLLGAELAVAEVNAQEGKHGVQFLLVLRQGDYVRSKDLSGLRALILEERVQYLLGAIPQGAIRSISLLAQQQNVPLLAFPTDFLDAPSVHGEPRNLFWISPAPEAFQRAAVRTAALFPQKRLFLLARDSLLGRGWSKYFWEELRRLKPDAIPMGEIFLREPIEDYDPYLRSVISSGAEVCFSHLGAKEWPRFARIGKQQRYFKNIVHFELESGNLESLVLLGKDAPEGVWGASAFPFWALEGKETRVFLSKFRAREQIYPNLSALSGYVSIWALLRAMKKAGSREPEKVKGALEDLSFPTPVGPLAIRRADHRVIWPIWCGTTKQTSHYPFAILEDLKAFGPDSFLPIPSKEEN